MPDGSPVPVVPGVQRTPVRPRFVPAALEEPRRLRVPPVRVAAVEPELDREELPVARVVGVQGPRVTAVLKEEDEALALAVALGVMWLL